MVTRSKAGIFKPKAFLTKAPSLSSDTPADIHEAMQSPDWAVAVNSELQALLKNNTWTLSTLPANRRVVGCKWLFKVKRKADGTVDRYKARLVAKGFSQHAGFDFRDTFSPVVRAATIQVVLALAIIKGWSLRAWFITLKQYLVTNLGFTASKADTSLFVRVSSDHIVLLMVYVDDTVITGSSTGRLIVWFTSFTPSLPLKTWGIEVQHTLQGLFLSQKKYILEILHKTGMTGATATPTPMVTTPKLTTLDSSPPFTDVHLYRSTVGMLQYLCITRPELSFCVNKLSQYMNLPSETHWRAVKRVLRYLVGTVDYGLCFSKGQPEVVCYSDADWASSMEDCRFTTGYVVYLGPNPVAWCSRKQPLIGEIGLSNIPPPVVWCDNTSTVSIAENPTHHARIKHVEIDHHFVREKVLDGTLQVNVVPSAEQVADVLTKPIAPKQFESFRQAFRVLKQDSVLSCSNEKETGRMLE
ncbi:hypothetical protein CXB51_021006 [Gossypium anomalum]|uniref:Reverse transcriptase Ty1/copia-type domain-containing protein n=1 Tax=Gossypium anomalum TaxID=47600 RepID=A0A8J5YV66_9ROSI|nr:hypothetical protein CXB51_021006 [Gossypium anomalum]